MSFGICWCLVFEVKWSVLPKNSHTFSSIKRLLHKFLVLLHIAGIFRPDSYFLRFHLDYPLQGLCFGTLTTAVRMLWPFHLVTLILKYQSIQVHYGFNVGCIICDIFVRIKIACQFLH